MQGMICPERRASASTLTRHSNSTAALGSLEGLPLELLHMIFVELDLLTLSSIARTCSRGVAVVQSLPEHRELMRYASSALAALGSTRLLRYHSAWGLHQALHSSVCWSCTGFGPFLHLPTCLRCCYRCLHKNQALWVVTPPQARDAFALLPKSLKRLPTMMSLPGKYHVGYPISRSRRCRLVSVMAAKRLALDEGSTSTSLVQGLEAKRNAGLSLEEYYTLRWLQDASLEPPTERPLWATSKANVPNDRYCGMASVAFPSILDGQLERGLWCLGCDKLYHEWSPSMPAALASQLVALSTLGMCFKQ